MPPWQATAPLRREKEQFHAALLLRRRAPRARRRTRSGRRPSDREQRAFVGGDGADLLSMDTRGIAGKPREFRAQPGVTGQLRSTVRLAARQAQLRRVLVEQRPAHLLLEDVDAGRRSSPARAVCGVEQGRCIQRKYRPVAPSDRARPSVKASCGAWQLWQEYSPVTTDADREQLCAQRDFRRAHRIVGGTAGSGKPRGSRHA
jgi:hypothetical protein